ncbi:hypothetical protein E2C01_100659 [Portunus trituberculatus]|uniref:Carboxylesterase type B domain-containing protein n=1 Tax=Portunus trituberculatus TaxID=210409 RepID=A0A5B7KJZ8_PORTR|nr:hypothetical protein [Portunus trituberculatus]
MKLLTAALVAAAVVEVALCGLQVVTEGGRIQGVGDATINGRTFHAFYSIPYARPPIGDYRFKVSYHRTYSKTFHFFWFISSIPPPPPLRSAPQRCFRLPGNAYCCGGSLVCKIYCSE